MKNNGKGKKRGEVFAGATRDTVQIDDYRIDEAVKGDDGEVIGWDLDVNVPFGVKSDRSKYYYNSALAPEWADKIRPLMDDGDFNGTNTHPDGQDGNFSILDRLIRFKEAEVVEDGGETVVMLSGILLNTPEGEIIRKQHKAGMKIPISISNYFDWEVGDVGGEEKRIAQGGANFKPAGIAIVGQGGHESRVVHMESAEEEDNTNSPTTAEDTDMDPLKEAMEKIGAQATELAKVSARVGTLTTENTNLKSDLSKEKEARKKADGDLAEAKTKNEAIEAENAKAKALTDLRSHFDKELEGKTFAVAVQGFIKEEFDGHDPIEAILAEAGGNVETATKILDRMIRASSATVAAKVGGDAQPIQEIQQNGEVVDDNPGEGDGKSEPADITKDHADNAAAFLGVR